MLHASGCAANKSVHLIVHTKTTDLNAGATTPAYACSDSASRSIVHSARRAVLLFVLAGSALLSACANDSVSEGDSPASSSVAASDLAVDSAPNTPSPETAWVADAWVRAGAVGSTTGGYATIHNPQNVPLQITGATSAASDTVELHETTEHDGMVHMEPQHALVIPAHDSVVFAPGGKHFMLRGLRRVLSAGDTVSVYLAFSDGSSLEFVAHVRPIGARQ